MEAFIYLNLVFIARMLLIFTVMMKYYHYKKGNTGSLFKVLAGIFYLVDILYNWLSTVYFLDLPAKYDETVSLRCTRYIKDGLGNNPIAWFRYGFARVIQYITEFSDPGHI